MLPRLSGDKHRAYWRLPFCRARPLFWKHEIKLLVLQARYLLAPALWLCVWGEKKNNNNGTKACFDSSFLICDGSHFHCRLPRPPVAPPKAAIILIYKYIARLFVVLLTHTHTLTQHTLTHFVMRCTNSHLRSWVNTHTHTHTEKLLFALMSCNRNPGNLLPFTRSLQALLKKSFVSALNPFKDCRRYWKQRESSTLHFHLYL